MLLTLYFQDQIFSFFLGLFTYEQFFNQSVRAKAKKKQYHTDYQCILKQLEAGKISNWLNRTMMINEHLSKYLSYLYNESQQILSFTDNIDLTLEILAHKSWFCVRHLSIEACSCDDLQLQKIMGYDWTNLSILNLQSNEITYSGVKQIPKGVLSSLNSIILSQNPIKGIGFTFILENSQNLKNFYASNCLIDKEGLKGSLYIKNSLLQVLNLSGNKIGKKGIQYLTKSQFLFLQELFLKGCQISNEGLNLLIKGLWPNLLKLIFNHNYIGLRGYSKLLQNNWARMKHLNEEDYGLVSIDPMAIMCLFSSKWKGADIGFWIQNIRIGQEMKILKKQIFDQEF